MKKNFNLKAVVGVVILSLFVLKFAANLVFSQGGDSTDYSASETVEILNNAETISVCKNYRTLFKNDYNVIVNGENVAVVTGKVFKIFGDTFTMYSSNGDVIMSEKEEKLHLNRQSQFFNSSEAKTGRLESKIFTLLDKDIFYDNNDNVVANCDEKFSIPTRYIIHSGNTDLYSIKKQFAFSNYTITVKDNSKLSPTDTVMITCIKSAISSSKSSKGSSSSLKK